MKTSWAFLFQPFCVLHTECPAQHGVCMLHAKLLTHHSNLALSPLICSTELWLLCPGSPCVKHSRFAQAAIDRQAVQAEKMLQWSYSRRHAVVQVWIPVQDPVTEELCQEVKHSLALHSCLPARSLTHEGILNCEIKCLRHQAIYLKDKILGKSQTENSHSCHSGCFFHPCSASPSLHGLHFCILPLVSKKVRALWRKGYVFLDVGMMLSPKGPWSWQGV